MPGSETRLVRIYCVCGQKMKVSEEMFGRPGKCVACRQKIRIPRLDEMPADTGVLYLKDHPEFLRKTKKRPVDKLAPPPAREVEIEPSERTPAHGSFPMDVLEVQRLLWCLNAKAKALQHAGEVGLDYEGPPAVELQTYRARIKSVLEDIEEELRQRLMETAIELTMAQENIAELNLAVRVSEVPFSEYAIQIDRLRRRRDAMERRQIDLRGWLAANSVADVGGYVDAGFNQIPGGPIRVTFSTDVEDAPTLLDWHVDGLRHALMNRAQAERAWRHAERSTLPPDPRPREDHLADLEAAKDRAESEAQYFRERLDQLARDYANDLQAIDAQLDHARNRLRIGAIDRDKFAAIERELVRSKTDYAKARRLVTRSLTANSPEEVPHPRGTFMERLAQSSQGMRVPLDAWLAWGAGLVLVVALFLPVAGDLSPLNTFRTLGLRDSAAHWLVSFPIGLAALLTVAGFVPRPTPRGLLVCGLWIAGSIVAVAYFHEASYYDGLVGDHLRRGGPYLLRPGVIAFAGALVLAAASACLALAPLRAVRAILPLAAVLVLAVAGVIVTDIGGVRRPRPAVSHGATLQTGAFDSSYETTLRIANEGQRLMLLDRASTMKNAYVCLLERQVGSDSWEDAGPPERIQAGGRTSPLPRPQWKSIPLAPGEAAVFTYRLPPGLYRVQVGSSQRGWDTVSTFTLEAPVPAPAPVESGPPETAPAGGATTPESGATEATTSSLLAGIAPAEVVLRGIVAQPGKAARFSLEVTLPDGRTSRRFYSVGDEVYDGWSVGEFNPEEQTVILTRGSALLILRRGDPYKLKPNA